MNYRSVIPLFALSVILSACQPAQDTKLDESEIKQRGQKAAMALKVGLLGQLQPAMKAGGPVAALPMCKAAAPALTTAASDSMPGISIRRTSDRVRNPDNAPDALDRKVLEIFQSAKGNKAELPTEHVEWLPESKDSKAPVARYYQPLMIKELCLNCHGAKDQIKPEVLALIQKLYPDDQATGYQAGDFRGLIRVDIAPLASP